MARNPKVFRRFNGAKFGSRVYWRTRRWIVRYAERHPIQTLSSLKALFQ